MAQSTAGQRNTDEWIITLQAMPAKALPEFVSAEYSRLAAQLMEPADALYAAMAAWQRLGAADSIDRVFHQLSRYLSGLTEEKRSWLRHPIRAFREFIAEPDEPAQLPVDTLRQLDAALLAADTYLQRMRVLAADHAAGLDAYAAWADALQGVAKETRVVQGSRGIEETVRRNTEFTLAQQQLLLTVRLQLQGVEGLAADARHVAGMARSLSQNKAAAAGLQAYLRGRK